VRIVSPRPSGRYLHQRRRSLPSPGERRRWISAGPTTHSLVAIFLHSLRLPLSTNRLGSVHPEPMS
jgi:hypothetical protein